MANVRIIGVAASHAKEASPVPATEAASGSSSGPLDERPRSLYEVVTRQMLEDLKADVGEIKGRVNTLLWLVVGAVVAEIVLRLVR